MSRWLDPVRRALDQATEPVSFFFRDDDAGWSDERLFQLLDLFAHCDMPLDLAVIPQSVTEQLARELCDRAQASPERIGLHQHGFSHANHEAEGRKCEFGPSRPAALQERDIETGKRILSELLGPIVQPIFTPPWNRCDDRAAMCLVRHGFRVLSRDHSANPISVSGLFQLPVRIDWFAKRKGVRLELNQVGALIAGAINDGANKDSQAIGVMFHHAIMDEAERRKAGELLSLLAGHDHARRHLMRSLAGAN